METQKRRNRGYPDGLTRYGYVKVGETKSASGDTWCLLRTTIGEWTHWKFVADGLVYGRANYLIATDTRKRTGRCDALELAIDKPELFAFWLDTYHRVEAESLC